MGRVGAGSGCRYLTRQVAEGRDDFAELSPAQVLAYYTDTRAHGESPGRWVGRGLATLGLTTGPVAASEVENLIGHARHPHFDELLNATARSLLDDRSLTPAQRSRALAAAEKSLHLGRAYAVYESAASHAERAVAELGPDADEASKDAVRAQVLAEGDRQAVAGYELTFTPVKSVSVLAAVGGEHVWRQVMDAHRAAVDTALAYVQQHASFSRAGVNGVRQVDTDGLIIGCFEHRMSREGDPNIHTHGIVANRVRCVDGKWRTVDGRAVYAASVGARAVYEQALESELAARLGARFSLDERHTIREITGIPAEVIEQFAKRRAAIQAKLDQTVDPAAVGTSGWRRLARRFTLSTRPDKAGPESTSEALTRWQAELIEHGHDPAALFAAATNASRRPRVSEQSDADIVTEATRLLAETRAVWTRHHAVLAVSRVLPPIPDRPWPAHAQRVERCVEQLLAGAVRVSPPDLLDVGPTLRRVSDGQSLYAAHFDLLYADSATAQAEQRILATLDEQDAPRLDWASLAPHVAAAGLGDDQDAAVHAALTTGARIAAIVGPAGSGKTYVQRTVAQAWTAERGPVLALAPSQIAAGVLADAVGVRSENVAKWLYEHRRAGSSRPHWTLSGRHLVILDEASMIATVDLDAIVIAVRRAGAKLLLVGDDKQLGAVGAGGMFATIVDRTRAPALSTVRRFHNRDGELRDWECAASLGLRDRDVAVLAEYERRGRLHSGPAQRMEQTSYRAWLADHLAFEAAQAGDVALLLADTEAAAASLAARARADLVERGLVEPDGTPLADGNRAGVGDLVVTRLNERRLHAEAGTGFVANRDTWRVIGRDDDGGLRVVAVTGAPRTLRLPANYVSSNVQLGYAGTVHSAEGRTVTTARALISEATSAQALYVALTRGWLANHAYVIADDTDREPHQRLPEQHALAVLARILDRDQTPSTSVTDAARDAYGTSTSLARLRIVFGDLVGVLRGHRYADLIGATAGQELAERALADPAWASLVRALAAAETRGWNSTELLHQAIGQRELGSAADVAAVLHWRCTALTAADRDPQGEDQPRRRSWQQFAAEVLADIDPATEQLRDAADALRQVAQLMDGRVSALAEHLAAQAAAPDPPAWLATLGPAPAAPGPRRDAWLDRAAVIAAHHDAVGYTPRGEDPLGPRPPAGDAEARALWSTARTVLAEAPTAATLRAMLPDRLRGWVADGIRAETVVQPTYVGHELRALSLRERAQYTRVTRLQTELTAADGQLARAQRQLLRRDQSALDSLARTRDRAAARLAQAERTLSGIQSGLRRAQRLHQAWSQWETDTRELRARARLAAQELSLRGLDTESVAAPVSPAPPGGALANGVPDEQYAIQAAAAAFFTAHLLDRWAPAYLAHRRLAEPAAAARVGYAPSRPGHWTLLVDHLRARGYTDHAIEASGLAVASSRGGLIDRFRDRVMVPILDANDCPIAFIGRKPSGDRDPCNPKYLNPTRTPLYDKSHVLYGLDTAAVERLHAGARPIIVEGVMDVLAIRAANADLVPLAPSGVALTDAHLDQLAQHTSLDRIVLGFDPDPAGQAAARRAGQKLVERGVPILSVDIFTGHPGADPADILAADGPTALAVALADRTRHVSLLDTQVDERLAGWWTNDTPLRELPIRHAAAADAARFVADHVAGAEVDPADIGRAVQRQTLRIAAATGVDAREISATLLDTLVPDQPDGPTDDPSDIGWTAAEPDAAEQDAVEREPELDAEPL